MNSLQIIQDLASQTGRSAGDVEAAQAAALALRTPSGTIEEQVALIEAHVPGAWARLRAAGLERIAAAARGEEVAGAPPP
jgi:hypothetical protein